MEFKYYVKSKDAAYIEANKEVINNGNLSLEAKGAYITICYIAQEIVSIGLYDGNKIDLETLTHYASPNDKKETLYKSIVELALNGYLAVDNGNIPSKIKIGLK